MGSEREKEGKGGLGGGGERGGRGGREGRGRERGQCGIIFHCGDMNAQIRGQRNYECQMKLSLHQMKLDLRGHSSGGRGRQAGSHGGTTSKKDGREAPASQP